MLALIRAALFLCLFTLPALADGGPNSIRVCDKIGCRYVNAINPNSSALPVLSQSKFGTYTPKAVQKQAIKPVAKSAPKQARIEPVSSGNAVVRSKTGKTAHVDAKHAARFQCLVDGLEAIGLKIEFMGGYRKGTCGQANMHSCGGGMALDVNQIARDVVTQRFPAGTNAVADRCGLLHGDRTNWTRAPDQGHFQVRTNVAAIKPHWPRTLDQTKLPADAHQASVQPHTDGGALLGAVNRIVDSARVSLHKLADSVRPHAEKIALAAEKHYIDPRYQLAMVYMESSFDPNDRAKTSSAHGLCQLLRADRRQFGLGENPTVEQQAEACALKTGRNFNSFRDIFSREPTPQEAYLVHWQGIEGATLILMAQPHERVETVLNRSLENINCRCKWGAVVVRANKVLRGMTVADYMRHIDKRMAYALQLVSA